jgi:hypothetical protein
VLATIGKKVLLVVVCNTTIGLNKVETIVEFAVFGNSDTTSYSRIDGCSFALEPLQSFAVVAFVPAVPNLLKLLLIV